MAAGWTIVRHKASAGHSAHLPAAAVLLAQTAMGAAVRSDAAAGVAPEASPAAIHPEAVSQAVTAAGVAEAVDQSSG